MNGSPRKVLAVLGLSLAALFGANAAFAAAPGNLDDLLEQTRTAREAEVKANAAREARFLAERNRQAAMMAEVRAEVEVERRRSTQLSTTFDANEKRLTDMQAQLDTKAGNLGEMFGVVRQVANDFSSVVTNSIISAQFPGRAEFVTKLAQSKSLPSMTDLERFWFELQREMTETGKVVKYKSKVISPEGAPVDATVTRVGPFAATADGRYLNYLPSQQALSIMARQPGSKFEGTAEDFEERKEGYGPSFVDPTRGTLLSIYAQRPTLKERIDHGEAVGYVILLVGAVGLLLGLYQLFHLSVVRAHVRNQLKFVKDPQMDNPLGRVLATFKAADTETLERSTDVIELRISEAVLKEVPKLERFQSFLRLAVAAGPLLGLIGTVIGMILTFQSITESGSSDPKLMAAGISQAMIATVLGLAIAIPLLFLNAWLVSLSKSIVQVLDEQSSGLLAERIEAVEGPARA